MVTKRGDIVVNDKLYKATVVPMSWLEWNETGMLRTHFPSINLIEGKHDTHHHHTPQEFMIGWETLNELAELFDVMWNGDDSFVVRSKGILR